MNRKYIYITLLLSLCLLSCSKEDDLGKIEPLAPDYFLPQGKSPADNRIVDFYSKYGTYILYEFTESDFNWSQMEGSSSDYTFTKADPQYAGEMLDLLEDTWVSLYPVDFHKKYMPYKIFLTKELFYGSSAAPVDVWVSQGQIAISHCSAALKEMSVEDKIAFKRSIQQALWEKWADKIEVPNAFFTLSDYSKNGNSNPESPDYPRTRGFVANNGKEWAILSSYEWWVAKSLDKMKDLKVYLGSMAGRTSEEWASDLKYPLVKQKYDILKNHISETYGFDIQEVGDAVCE